MQHRSFNYWLIAASGLALVVALLFVMGIAIAVFGTLIGFLFFIPALYAACYTLSVLDDTD